MKNSLILGRYKNGNYDVVIFKDGTKVRSTEAKEFIPNFPENADVKITDKCSQGCSFCYEGCTKEGKHAELLRDGEFAQSWMNTLMPYTELALNGNDLDHPDLVEFLCKLKDKKIIPNLTVHQNQFMQNTKFLQEIVDDKLIYGLGVSLQNPTKEFLEKFKLFDNAVLHTIAGILDLDDIITLAEYDIKLLILGFKELGRGIPYQTTYKRKIWYNIEDLKIFLSWLVEHTKVLSFDNLALEQLNVKEILFKDRQEDWDKFFMGEDGNFTLYIDAVNQTFAKNSCMPQDKRYPCGDKTMKEMFDFIHNNY